MSAILSSIGQAAPALAMLAAFALVLGGGYRIRQGDRRKGVLMIVLAAVLIGNVLILTI